MTLRHLCDTDEKITTQWRTLWFAKGALQAPLDTRLRMKYGPLCDALGNRPAPQPPASLSAPARLTWRTALLIAYDQLPRNIYRGTARAYATDGLALALAKELAAEASGLPLPIRPHFCGAGCHPQ